MNDSLRRKASAAIQGISNEVAATRSNPPSMLPTTGDQSDSDDFMPCSQNVNKSVKRKKSGNEHVIGGSNSGEIFKFLNSITAEKKYKKIQINMELIDSD